MGKKTTVVQKTEEIVDENSPGIVAYRVGKLEEATTNGFNGLKDEIKALKDSFITEQRFADAEKASEAIHQSLSIRIGKIEKWLDWATRIVLGAVILAVLALVVGSQIAN